LPPAHAQLRMIVVRAAAPVGSFCTQQVCTHVWWPEALPLSAFQHAWSTLTGQVAWVVA
jgi:hypothetical protein